MSIECEIMLVIAWKVKNWNWNWMCNWMTNSEGEGESETNYHAALSTPPYMAKANTHSWIR